ncbi:MAG: hypothetical protein ACM359_16285 [Bacillota bacterium]
MMRFTRSLGLFLLLLLCAAATNPALRNSPKSVPLSLKPTLSSPILDITHGPIRIQGTVTAPDSTPILLRVTTSLDAQSVHTVTATQSAFSCLYPTDFKGAPPLSPSMLFIDATLAPDFDVNRPGHFQAEAALILCDSASRHWHRAPVRVLVHGVSELFLQAGHGPGTARLPPFPQHQGARIGPCTHRTISTPVAPTASIPQPPSGSLQALAASVFGDGAHATLNMCHQAMTV